MSETSGTLRVAALTAHVPENLAAEVRALAERAERSISREVTLALRRHVAEQSRSSAADPSQFGGGSRAASARREDAEVV